MRIHAKITDMKTSRKTRVVLVVLAVLAAVFLFATYGTVLPSAPFASVQLNGPTVVDSDGEFTGVVDTESRRALILNADGDLTGVVDCTTIDSPLNAITDVCVSGGSVYLAGMRYEPDSNIIAKERVACYDKGGNFQGLAFEIEGAGDIPSINALCDVPGGVAVVYEPASDGDSTAGNVLAVERIGLDEREPIGTIAAGPFLLHDAAVAASAEGYRYATLNVRGMLSDGKSEYAIENLAGHVFTSIDIEEEVLYACDDTTGALCAISLDTLEVSTLVSGTGYHSVHSNQGVISLCNSDTDTVKLRAASREAESEFSSVKPSAGFSARMLVVWASGLYLAALALALCVRKIRQMAKSGNTSSITALLTAAAAVTTIVMAVGSFSFASYQKTIDLRTNEVNMCADYLAASASNFSKPMEQIGGRSVLVGSDDSSIEATMSLLSDVNPVLSLAQSAQDNGIGLYCSLYGKDDQGAFFFCGSLADYVMGSSARGAASSGLDAAFDGGDATNGKLFWGRTLHDATQYRLVQIPSTDGKSVVGVIEVGSKMRSLESSIIDDLSQRILALLVLILVAYLAYSELRACGRCLFSYRQRRQADGVRAVATLTRPFTLAITVLSSIDSVMTVLIARDLLSQAGMSDSTPLLAVPAVMLGVGMILGQGLYAIAESRVGLRKLVVSGALAVLACACATCAAVYSGVFWLYCVAKLAMAVPFGMLYSLGYSLPRLAADAETRASATGDVKRTDTSAAALGTVLGGYVAQTLGNVWVYALVAMASLPVILMAANLLPRGMQPLGKLAYAENGNGRIRDLARTRIAFCLALFVILPATLAAGYASFLFPIFSVDLGLSKFDINNIFALGQLVVFVSIGLIERLEGRYGRWSVSTTAIALLGLVFLLFAINTTLVWSIAVIALVGLLCKSTDGWKAMWLKAAEAVGVPTGRATSAMFATRSLALIAQPFVLGALLGATDSVAVIVIGLICVACAGLFFLTTRHTLLAE